jgi:hypothetical protein
MIDNRWLVEIFEKKLFTGAATPAFRINLGNWLDEVDNASSWAGYWYGDSTYWSDTRLYTPKQIRAKVLEAVRRAEERRRKWLENQDE